MSDYTKTVDFAAKDALASGNPAKAAKGVEVDTEYDNIATAIGTKYDVTDRDVANGICPLDVSALVPAGNIPIATEIAVGGLEVATTAETEALTDDDKLITPLKMVDALTQYSGEGLLYTAGVGSLDIFGLATATIVVGDFLGFSENAAADVTGKVNVAGLNGVLTGALLSDYDANVYIDHSTVDIIAGTGLTGGGDLTVDRTLNVIGGEGIEALSDSVAMDVPSLTTEEGNILRGQDEFLFYDLSVEEHKSIEVRNMGCQIQTAQTSQTISSLDMNTIMEFNGTQTLTIPINSGTPLPEGAAIVIVVDHASQEVTIQAASGVTLNSTFHPGGTAAASDVVIAGGMAVLLKTQTNEWYLSGDISD